MKYAITGLLISITLAVVLQVQAASALEGKYVHAVLQSNWKATPIPQEIAEFIGTEDNELFWKYVETLGSSLDSLTSDEAQYNVSFEKAVPLLSSIQVDLLELALGLRYFSPRVQLYRQLVSTVLESSDDNVQTKIKECVDTAGLWVQINNQQVVCDAVSVEGAISSASSNEVVDVYNFDHVFPGSGSPTTIAILYGDIGTSAFFQFHTILKNLATEGTVQYVLRHVARAAADTPELNLGGYGVELALKSLEYKTVDDSKPTEGDDKGQGKETEIADNEEIEGFLFGALTKRKPQLASELATFRSFLLSNQQKFEDLKVWDLKDIGFQSAQRVLSSSDPLRSLRDISQNFPTLAVSLSKVKLDPEIPRLVGEFQQRGYVAAGGNAVLLNGRVIDPATIDPYILFNNIREELEKVDAVSRLHISKQDAFKLLALPPQRDNVEKRFAVNSPAISWVNNLEKDERYNQWPKNLNELFRRVWQGSFRYIAKNLFTVVVVIDPSSPDSLRLPSLVERMISQSFPMRYGFLFATENYGKFARKLQQRAPDTEVELEDTLALKVTRLYHHLSTKHSTYFGLFFLSQLFQASSGAELNVETTKSAFVSACSRLAIRNAEDTFNRVINSNEYDSIIRQSNEFIVSKGFHQLPVAFENGVPLETGSPDAFYQSVAGQYFQQSGEFQIMVQQGKIRDSTDIYAYLQSQPDLLARYNSLILPSSSNKLHFEPLTKDTATQALRNVLYLVNPQYEDVTQPITHLVVADLTTMHGRTLAYEAVQQLPKTDASLPVRVGFVFNPAPGTAPDSVTAAITAALSTQTKTKALNFVLKLLELATHSTDDQAPEITDAQIAPLVSEFNLNAEKFNLKFAEVKKTPLQFRQFLSYLGLKAGEAAIITNGRVIRVPAGSLFHHDDFLFLSQFEHTTRARKVVDALNLISFVGVEPDDQTSDFVSDVVMKVVSVLGRDEENGAEKIVLPQDIPAASFRIRNESAAASFEIVAVINPLSTPAQRFTPILETLVRVFDVDLTVFLNPVEVSDLPLKNFYTYVIDHELQFDQNGRYVGPSASFAHLPTSRLLTLNLHTPESWLVTPTVAKYDLDNIKLDDLPNKERVLYAQFQLQHVLVEGNCYDWTDVPYRPPTPPRGLELVLGTPKHPTIKDTIVMSNFGYFQLKANPGVWFLNLKPNSRSSDLYQIVSTSSDTEEERPASQRGAVAVLDFTGEIESLKVRKQPGKEGEQLLVENDSGGSVWDSISGMWTDTKKEENETIHVFSLASGHLYERFLKIMMSTVVKHTKQPVKFWLLANFLSPRFSETVPALASKLNFQYEFVTYKWPSWLHKQTEKQRIIWGYKILFLDVLFPLDLKKVIYVDADQVVRADLKELWDMDLNGAPYAYTPFCDSNRDTEGFRFWKQGFWINHLRGLPYHISALYVVDLVRFRRVAAGDNLRAVYAQLSPDPNSLANLDQDLPNYMQHMVPIHSLPQEWLWCETWCSNDTKSTAKTIDLCNNPLTKIPKLENAVRIIPEWPELDNEIKAIEREYFSPQQPQQQQEQEHQHQDSTAKQQRDSLKDLAQQIV